MKSRSTGGRGIAENRVRSHSCVSSVADAVAQKTGVIDHESPCDSTGSPGTLRNPGPGRGPGPNGAEARPGNAQDRAATSQEREADVRAITDLLASFVKAYNAKDAKTLGDLFTPDAEIEDEDGEVTRGRDAIVERFSGIFRKAAATHSPWIPTPCGSSGTTSPSRREPRRSPPGGEPPDTNRYSVIYARQDGRWLHARIRDEQAEEVSPHEQLRELEWMLGEWVNESDDGIVYTPASGRTTATSCSGTST